MSNTFLYVAAVLIWGSTWFAIEFQLGVVEPEVSIAYRYFSAAAILFIWCKIRGLNLSFKVQSHAWFAVMGLLIFSVNYILAYRSQVYITSALAAIIFSCMQWMNILNGRLFFAAKVGPRLYLGAGLGILGIACLFGPELRNFSLSSGVLLGSTLAFIGAYTASLGNIASQSAQKHALPVVQSNAWSMLYGGIFTALIALVQGHELIFDWRPGYLWSFAYLTVFGSVLAFGAYLTLLGRIGVQKAGYATVLFPVVALLLSMTFEGLQLNGFIIAGVALVLGGNLLVMTDRSTPSLKENSE